MSTIGQDRIERLTQLIVREKFELQVVKWDDTTQCYDWHFAPEGATGEFVFSVLEQDNEEMRRIVYNLMDVAQKYHAPRN